MSGLSRRGLRTPEALAKWRATMLERYDRPAVGKLHIKMIVSPWFVDEQGLPSRYAQQAEGGVQRINGDARYPHSGDDGGATSGHL